MFEKVKENIWLLVVQMMFTIAGLLIYGYIQAQGTKINNIVSKEYVDEENNKQDVVCKDTKTNLQKQIDTKASQTYVVRIDRDGQYNKEKLDDIYRVLLEIKNRK